MTTLNKQSRHYSISRFITWFLVLAYSVWLIYRAGSGAVGPDVAEYLATQTGEATIYLLLLTLSITPYVKFSKRTRFARLRRHLGLASFFMAFLHVLSYLGLFVVFDWAAIEDDLTKRPYIIVGFIAFVTMAMLAVTSNRFSQIKLKQRWKKLHRLVYVIAVLSLLHIWWQVRSDFYYPLIYSMIFAWLMLLRYRY